MIRSTDHTGRVITLSQTPTRIVSLVPSQTELLYALGLEEEVVGITKFCIHPDHWFRQKQRVGGTKDIRPVRIAALQPDLILANKEENIREQVEALYEIAPVWTSDVDDLNTAMDMISQIGRMTNREEKALSIVHNIQERFAALTKQLNEPVYRAAYLIWREPYMTIGGDTFIHHILQKAGFENVFGEQQRYPVTDLPTLKALEPEFIFLSSEPYPFRQQHVEELQQHLPNTRILLVDGELFSWYGSRLLDTPAYLQQLRASLIV